MLGKSWLNTIGVCCALLVASLVPLLETATAQAPEIRRSYDSPTGTTIFAITMLDNFPYTGADAVIIRRAQIEPHDIVAVRSGRATAPLLIEAAKTLAALREHRGDTSATNVVYRVGTPRGTARYEAYARDWMQMLSLTEPRDLPGLGVRPFILTLLPNQRR